VVFLPSKHKVTNDPQDGEWGWNDFTLTERETKLQYLAANVRRSVEGVLFPARSTANLSEQEELAVDLAVEALVGVKPLRGAGIDHQSQWNLPINGDFLGAIAEFLSRDDVAILGGNDNSDYNHPVLDLGEVWQIPWAVERTPFWVSKNEGWWSLYDPESGGKTRFSVRDDVQAVRSLVPELVDMKITGYCPFFDSSDTCRSCYQGSDLKGTHADLSDIKTYLYALSRAGVFEVAFGGGEPTLHPEIDEILRECRARRIQPSLTTRNLSWVKKNLGGPWKALAYSVSSLEDVKAFHEIVYRKIPSYGADSKQVSVQVVLGTIPNAELFEIFKFCASNYFNLVALGWKTTGRGGSGPPYDNTGWEDMAQQAGLTRLGVDTVAASAMRWDPVIRDLSVTTHEGRFSCYIDAVAHTLSPSSFSTEQVAFKPTHWHECFVEAWQGLSTWKSAVS
jgi:hypothetical protein